MSVNVSVLFHLNGASAPGIFRFMPDYPDSVVAPSIRVAARDAFREFSAVEVVTTKRMVVGELMSKLLVERVSHALKQRRLHENAIVVDDVQLRDIGLPPELQASITKVQQELQAGNERRQAIKTAEQEAERSRIEAEGAAQVSRIKAENAAKVRLIAAEAEAQSNERIAKSLTPAVIRLREIEAQRAILESNGTRTVILGGQGGQTPAMMLNLQ
jgi:regulator of protease activity HflC (stomatin/prohibitin superfamily)